MRLDKYLKQSRLIVRRTVAKNVCDEEKIIVNGLPAKGSKKLKVNDIIELNFNKKQVKVKVLEVPEKNVKPAYASNLYEVIEEKEI